MPINLTTYAFLYLRLVVLQSVSFIHNETGPVNRPQYGHINCDQFIGGEKHVELHSSLLLQRKRDMVMR